MSSVPTHPFTSQAVLARANATPEPGVQDLQEQIDSQDRFLSMVSHELRNYVTMMKVTTQLLNKRSKQAEDESLLRLGQRMDRQLTQATNLISDLLDRAKKLFREHYQRVRQTLLQMSSAFHPSISCRVMTARWLGGNTSFADKMQAIVSCDKNRLSGKSFQFAGGETQHPGSGESIGKKQSGSTSGSSGLLSSFDNEEKGTQRFSRTARVFAQFVRMRKIQVLSEERRSKRLIPWSTPTQAS